MIHHTHFSIRHGLRGSDEVGGGGQTYRVYEAREIAYLKIHDSVRTVLSLNLQLLLLDNPTGMGPRWCRITKKSDCNEWVLAHTLH